MNSLRALMLMMETINSFVSYFASPPSSSSRPPQTPSPPSEEPTTSSENSSSGGNTFKTSLENNSKNVEYLKLPQDVQDPKDPQDPTILFRFVVYAAGGTLPSEVKKVTRETPKDRKSTFDCASSKQATQYSWVVRHQCRKKRKRSEDPPLKDETLQAETGDIATHEEDIHEEDTQEEDTHEGVHEKDAHEEAFCEKSVPGKDSKKSVTFDMSANPPRKSALKATLRDTASAPISWRLRFFRRPRFRFY